ncbi:helix-turn-helix transcriptional regulator [Lachnospiraceae bacterium JLR.KK009]
MNVELYLKEMGQRIMERRKKLGLTQEALAEMSELTTQFVSYAESGKRGMRPENLMKVAAALGVSTDYLLTGGRTRKAIKETIRICKDKNVLKEYLESREQEVLDMLMELYDQAEVMSSYLESERYEAAQEDENATKIETAKRLLRMGKLSIEDVAAGSGLTVKEVEELAGLQTV